MVKASRGLTGSKEGPRTTYDYL